MPEPTPATPFTSLCALLHGKAPPLGNIGTIEFSSNGKSGTIQISRNDDGTVALKVTFPGLNLECDLTKDGKPAARKAGAPAGEPNGQVALIRQPDGDPKPVMTDRMAGQIAPIVKSAMMKTTKAPVAAAAKPPAPVPEVTDHTSAQIVLYDVILGPPPAPPATPDEKAKPDRRDEFWVAVGKGRAGFTVECCGPRGQRVTYFRIHRRDVDPDGKITLDQTLEFESTTLSKGEKTAFPKGVANIYEGKNSLSLARDAVLQTFIAWVRVMHKSAPVSAPTIKEVAPPPPPVEPKPDDKPPAAAANA